jgi:RNA polymerase sigma factor (sigma-70 family)
MWLTGKKINKETEDSVLIAQYRENNDRKALGILFERYSHLVYGVCLKYLKNTDDSKDATLNIFEKLMTDLKRFQIEKFNFWIHSVSRNHCLMILRSKKQMLSIDVEEGRGIDSFSETHQAPFQESYSDKENQLNMLEAAIQLLNEEQRICIELFYLKKYSYQDVSEISGFSLLEVKSYIQNGKRNLKIHMTRNTNEINKS